MKTTVLIALLCGSACTASAGDIVIAGFGGNVQTDLSRTLWQPAAKAIGANLIEQTHDGLGAVRVQVQSGNPGIDVVHLGAEDCSRGGLEGLFEPIDYSVVDASGVIDQQKGRDWVGINSYSVVLAWRTDVYGDNPPENWADFWDVDAFPGRRSLGVYPQEMMEIALLSEGVAKDAIYPLDSQQALDRLAEIQPDISVWWTSGAQSAQLIADGEVDMAAIWSSRVIGVIANGAPVAFTYNDGILGTGCLAILKGSKNIALAQEFVAGAVSAKLQARIPEMMPYYSPTNSDAFALSTADPAVLEDANTAPANAALQLPLNFDWWSENMPEMVEEYRMLIGQ